MINRLLGIFIYSEQHNPTVSNEVFAISKFSFCKLDNSNKMLEFLLITYLEYIWRFFLRWKEYAGWRRQSS